MVTGSRGAAHGIRVAALALVGVVLWWIVGPGPVALAPRVGDAAAPAAERAAGQRPVQSGRTASGVTGWTDAGEPVSLRLPAQPRVGTGIAADATLGARGAPAALLVAAAAPGAGGWLAHRRAHGSRDRRGATVRPNRLATRATRPSPGRRARPGRRRGG